MNYTVSGATTITFSNNLVESLTTANGQGYTNAQTYVYSPTSGSSPTVGAGINLTSTYWPAGFTTNDTTFACSESTVSGVVQSVCPARPANSRPSSGAWDSGAYEYVGITQAGSPTCVPGSGTYSGGQGIVCTNPNAGTTIQCYTTNGTSPQTNGAGTLCIVGTSLASGGTVVISSSKTLNLVAGTSTQTDSSVASYAYVISGAGGGSGMTLNTGTINTGTIN